MTTFVLLGYYTATDFHFHLNTFDSIYFSSGQAKKVHRFFEDLIASKQIQKSNQRTKYPIQRIKQQTFHSDVFQKLIERFDNGRNSSIVKID